MPVLIAKLVTTASATNLLPHRHPLACWHSSSVRCFLNTPHPFSAILRDCTSPCFQTKSNHVSLSTSWSWLTNAFSSKGQIFTKKSPHCLLSYAIHSLPLHTLPTCTPSSYFTSPEATISFQTNLSKARPSGVLIRSGTTQSMMILHISSLLGDYLSAPQHPFPFFCPKYT